MKNNLLILFLLLPCVEVLAWPLPGYPGYECMTMGQGSEILCYYDDSQGGGCQIIVTNVTGTCTNCTAMSPSDCQSAKDEILANLDSVNDRLTDVLNDINSIWYNGSPSLNDLYNQGNDFLEPGLSNGGVWYYSSSVAPSLQELYDSFGEFGGYITDSGSIAIHKVQSSAYSRAAYYGGIYTYYNSSIKPALEYVYDVWDEVYGKVSDERDRSQDLRSYVDDNINCSSCSSGGSGGGGGSSPGISTGCPCSETMKSLLDVVQAIKLDTASIDLTTVKIRELAEKIKSLLKDINNNVSNITYSVGRLDDYVTDDLSNSVYRIEIAISNLVSSVLSNNYNESFISLSYSNAVERAPTKSWHDTLTATGAFDFVSYSSRSNWFSRIEYLLMRSAGVFDSLGTTNAEFTTSEQAEIDNVNEDDWKVDGLKSLLVQNLNSLKDKKSVFKPFEGVFNVRRSDLQSKITLLPDVSLGDSVSDGVIGSTNGSSSASSASFISLVGSTFPAVEIDLDAKGDGDFSLMDFVDLSHSVFRWIWYLLGFVLLFGMIVTYVRIVFVLLAWWHKITRAWASNLIDDKGFR